jgi:LmbE family N-acetylglucosaminyl deacetylase
MATSDTVLILAPHTDDGELGCGGSISRFIEEGKSVYYAAFSTAAEAIPPEYPPDILKREVKEATRVLGIDSKNLLLFNYQVRKLEFHRQEILDDLLKLKNEIRPQVVFMPCQFDLHQDHKTIHNEGLRAFKDCTVLGYELPWNNIAFHTRHFVCLEKRHIQKKYEVLRSYQSQAQRHYVNEDFIFGLARTRGVQIGELYAEAFDVIRWVLK